MNDGYVMNYGNAINYGYAIYRVSTRGVSHSRLLRLIFFMVNSRYAINDGWAMDMR